MIVPLKCPYSPDYFPLLLRHVSLYYALARLFSFIYSNSIMISSYRIKTQYTKHTHIFSVSLNHFLSFVCFSLPLRFLQLFFHRYKFYEFPWRKNPIVYRSKFSYKSGFVRFFYLWIMYSKPINTFYREPHSNANDYGTHSFTASSFYCSHCYLTMVLTENTITFCTFRIMN